MSPFLRGAGGSNRLQASVALTLRVQSLSIVSVPAAAADVDQEEVSAAGISLRKRSTQSSTPDAAEAKHQRHLHLSERTSSSGDLLPRCCDDEFTCEPLEHAGADADADADSLLASYLVRHRVEDVTRDARALRVSKIVCAALAPAPACDNWTCDCGNAVKGAFCAVKSEKEEVVRNRR